MKPPTPTFKSDINVSIDNQIQDLGICKINENEVCEMKIEETMENYLGKIFVLSLESNVSIENILKKFVILINKHPNREQLELEEVLEECWDETEKYFKGKEK